MGKTLGDVKKAYIKASSSYTWLGGEQNNTVNRSANAVEVSDKDSAWQQFISGKKGATVEVTVFADDSDAAQVAALSALEDGTEVDWAVGVIDSSAATLSKGDYGKGIITAVNDTNDTGAVSSRTISITATGEVTRV